MKNFPLTVVDNFFDDPMPALILAQTTEYNSPTETTYPGVHSKKETHDLHKQMHDWMMFKLLNLFYDPENTNLSWHVQSDFQKITPYGNRNQFHILNRGIPHIDSKGTAAAGVIYLNEKPCKDSGTSFYDRKDGNEFYMFPPDFLEASRKHHSGEEVEGFEEMAQKHLDHFDETARVQAKFNRLVFYSAEQWHSQTTYGKKSMGDRLTLRFFINTITCQEQHMPLRRVI